MALGRKRTLARGGGSGPASLPAFRVCQDAAGRAVLAAGQAHGLHAGTRVAVYDRDRALAPRDALRPPAEGRLATAEVARAGGLTSELKVTEGTLPREGQALVLARAYGELRLPVLVEGAAARSRLLAELRKSALVTPVTDRGEEHRLWLAPEARNGKPGWALKDPADRRLAVSLDPDQPGGGARDWFAEADVPLLAEALDRYARALNLRELRNPDVPAEVLKQLPITVVVEERVDGKWQPAARDPAGVWLLHKGRELRLLVDNRPGPEVGPAERDDLHFTFGILALDAGGGVAFVGPVPRAERRLFPRGEGAPPLVVGGTDEDPVTAKELTPRGGMEYFKAIFARAGGGRPVLDLQPLEQPELIAEVRSGKPLPADPLAWLLRSAAAGARRGEAPKPVPTLEWFALTLPYRVVPAP